MNTLQTVETIVRWAGAAGIVIVTAIVLWSVLRGRSRQKSRISGQGNRLVSSPWFILAGSVIGIAIIVLLWIPLPIALSDATRIVLLIVGGLAHFGGLAITVWGRIALGEMHNVSSSLGVELYADHTLITAGPYGLVRHPMYVGALLAGIGALLLYQTWAVVLIAAGMPNFIRRAHNEEKLLAAEFGAEWDAYCQRVPAWIPRFGRPEEAATDRRAKHA